MKNITRNWKTSLIGGGALTTGISIIVNDPTQWKEGLVACLVGLVGLLAKDSGVSGTGR